MIFVTFSIDQLVNYELNGFIDWLSLHNRQAKDDEVWSWIADTIKPLRADLLKMTNFCHQFNQKFNSNKDDKQMPVEVFEGICKSMARVIDEAQKNYIRLNEYLNQYDHQIKWLWVHTNNNQVEYILKQFRTQNYAIIDGNTHHIPNSNLLFCTSMQSKVEQHRETFKFALNQMRVSTKDNRYQFLSFLNTIQEEEGNQYIDPYKFGQKKLDIDHVFSLVKEYAKKIYYYVPYDPNKITKEHLIAIESIGIRYTKQDLNYLMIPLSKEFKVELENVQFGYDRVSYEYIKMYEIRYREQQIMFIMHDSKEKQVLKSDVYEENIIQAKYRTVPIGKNHPNCMDEHDRKALKSIGFMFDIDHVKKIGDMYYLTIPDSSDFELSSSEFHRYTLTYKESLILRAEVTDNQSIEVTVYENDIKKLLNQDEEEISKLRSPSLDV